MCSPRITTRKSQKSLHHQSFVTRRLNTYKHNSIPDFKFTIPSSSLIKCVPFQLLMYNSWFKITHHYVTEHLNERKTLRQPVSFLQLFPHPLDAKKKKKPRTIAFSTKRISRMSIKYRILAYALWTIYLTAITLIKLEMEMAPKWNPIRRASGKMVIDWDRFFFVWQKRETHKFPIDSASLTFIDNSLRNIFFLCVCVEEGRVERRLPGCCK